MAPWQLRYRHISFADQRNSLWFHFWWFSSMKHSSLTPQLKGPRALRPPPQANAGCARHRARWSAPWHHRLDAKRPTQWARRASGWRCPGTSSALWGLGVPLRAQDAPPEAPLGALGVPLLRGEKHHLAIQFLWFLWSFMACHARDRYSTQYLVATGKERSSQTNLWEFFFQKHWLARAKPYNVPFEETCPNQNSEKTVGNTW